MINFHQSGLIALVLAAPPNQKITGKNMNLPELITLIKSIPENVEFDAVIDTINNSYHYTPSKFINGKDSNIVVNEAGTNEGSCKILAFAKLNDLTKQQTLACFGKYYRDDVVKHPDGSDHGNIRALLEHSLDTVNFDKTVLVLK